MAGRKPKPTALKKLEGNPGKRKMNTKEPVPGKGMLGSNLAGVTVAIVQRLVHQIVALKIRVQFPVVTPWVGMPSGEGGGL